MLRALLVFLILTLGACIPPEETGDLTDDMDVEPDGP